MLVGVLYIATGQYLSYFDEFYSSSEKYFFINKKKHYFVFTDKTDYLGLIKPNVTVFYQKQMPWPYITLLRFKMFTERKGDLKKCDYLFFCNANSLFLDYVGEEILPGSDNSEMVGATSNPFVFSRNKREWAYDRNPRSSAFVHFEEGRFYFRGGFNGGTSQAYLKMSEVLDNRIQRDLKENVIALWHDESHLNRYFIDLQPPPRVLDPGYAYGEQWPGRQKLIEPLILMRDKSKMPASLEASRSLGDRGNISESRASLRMKLFNRAIILCNRLKRFFPKW